MSGEGTSADPGRAEKRGQARRSFAGSKEVGLPVDETKLQAHEALCDAAAPISKNFDPKKDPQRTINPGDLVHESVKPRGRSGGKEHNDPPPGVRIARG